MHVPMKVPYMTYFDFLFSVKRPIRSIFICYHLKDRNAQKKVKNKTLKSVFQCASVPVFQRFSVPVCSTESGGAAGSFDFPRVAAQDNTTTTTHDNTTATTLLQQH